MLCYDAVYDAPGGYLMPAAMQELNTVCGQAPSPCCGLPLVRLHGGEAKGEDEHGSATHPRPTPDPCVCAASMAKCIMVNTHVLHYITSLPLVRVNTVHYTVFTPLYDTI